MLNSYALLLNYAKIIKLLALRFLHLSCLNISHKRPTQLLCNVFPVCLISLPSRAYLCLGTRWLLPVCLRMVTNLRPPTIGGLVFYRFYLSVFPWDSTSYLPNLLISCRSGHPLRVVSANIIELKIMPCCWKLLCRNATIWIPRYFVFSLICERHMILLTAQNFGNNWLCYYPNLLISLPVSNNYMLSYLPFWRAIPDVICTAFLLKLVLSKVVHYLLSFSASFLTSFITIFRLSLGMRGVVHSKDSLLSLLFNYGYLCLRMILW